MRAFAIVLPLASVSGGNAFLLITKAVSSFIKVTKAGTAGISLCGVCALLLKTMTARVVDV